MSFVANVLVFLAVAVGVMTPLFIGHGLVTGSGTAIGIGIGALVVAALLAAIVLRMPGGLGAEAQDEAGG